MTALRPCVRCSQPLSPDAHFCPNCGHPIQAPTELDEQRHRRVAASAPPLLADKIRAASLKGERKPVTALFADVVGSTAILERVDPETWTDILNQAFQLMSDAIYRYEGTIANLLGDGLLAFFGTPIAHEDDPERAARAALDILDTLRPFSAELDEGEGIEFRVRIGLNTGTVIAGDVGSDLRYQYTAIGDAVNVAARIQGEARPGTILVAGPTYRFIAPKFNTRYVGPLTLRGKTEPVMAYELLGLKAVPQPARGLPGMTSSLVGRQQSLAQLEDLIEAVVTRRRGAAALVVGEPGIGKSRLLQELRHSRGAHKIAWAEGRCLSFGRGLPHHLLLDLLRSLLDLGTSTDQSEVEATLSAHLDGLAVANRPEVHRYLAQLLGLSLSASDQQALEALPEAVRHERLLASLNVFFGHIASAGPQVLVCEDVHWADHSSIELLKGILREIANLPLLLLFTSRPEPDAPIDELAERAAQTLGQTFRRIRLEPLSEAESRSLVAELLEIESLPLNVRDLILYKSEGNPLFVEEIIRMLMEQGAIVRANDKWIAGRDAWSAQVPTTLHSLLLARVDRLPEEAKRTARIAAVIGREFDVRILAEILESVSGSFQVEGSLRALDSFGLINFQGSGSTYAFRHALIEDAVYDSILQRDRSRLHGEVAEALERVHSPDPDQWAAVLAMHFEKAGNIGRSVDYLLRAGADAMRRFAPMEAYDLFGRAFLHLSSMSPEPEIVSKRIQAGLARSEAGRTFIPGTEELAELENLLVDAEVLGDPIPLAEIHTRIAEARHEMGEIPAVSPALARSVDTAEQIARELDDDRLRAYPLALRGFSHFAASEFRQAVTLLERAVSLLERHVSLTKAAYSAGVLAISAARIGLFDVAETWIEEAQSLARRSQDPSAAMDVDLHRGVVEGERGNITQALAFAKRGTELAERINNKACALVGYFIMGDQQLRLGLPEDARRSLERSMQIAEFCNVADIENLSRAWLTAALSQLGDDDQALPGLDDSLARARDMGDRLGEGEILRQRAIARARKPVPDWDAIRADFDAALAIFEGIEALPYVARALRDYGITLQTGRHIGEGQQKLRRAFELFESMRMRYDDRIEQEATEVGSQPR
jgi:predicted ATPase/class 3 adenylate cyclase